MSNESLFLISALADITFVFFSARRGINWLLGTVIVNLMLVAIFGAKLVVVFGLTTNAGNVFYACVFLATHFLLERHGKQMGLKTIWYGASFMIFFALMSQFATQFTGISLSDGANNAILTLFSFSLRITFASILAYIFAQCVNVLIYEWLKEKARGKFLWLRINGSNIISQLVDSMLFFSIAFFDLPGPILVQAILVGWFIKTLVVSMGTPFLYIDAYLERKKI
ncbi:MAG: queuosine precursor transporter [Patescibacteria group bacterium]